MPIVAGPFDIPGQLSSKELQQRKGPLQQAFDANKTGPASNLEYLAEAYYFVPVQLAFALQRAGSFQDALDWLRTVYDYIEPENARKIYPGLIIEESLSEVYKRAQHWLLDPLNPHAVAATRRNTYTRFTLLSIVRCLLDFADMEFTRDTAESIPRARRLYLSALELLGSDALKQRPKDNEDCDEIIGTLDDLHPLADGRWAGHVRALQDELSGITDPNDLRQTVTEIRHTFTGAGTPERQFANAKRLVTKALSKSIVPSLGAVLAEENSRHVRMEQAILSHAPVVAATETVGSVAAEDFQRTVSMVTGVPETKIERGRSELKWLREPISATDTKNSKAGEIFAAGRLDAGRLNFLAPSYIGDLARVAAAQPMAAVTLSMETTALRLPSLILKFCVPPNPTLQALRLRAQLNLRKLRTCRNIASMRRELETYAAPTDTKTGLPTIAGGQLTLPGISFIRPTLYRYPALIERAKQLVSIAAQIEASMLTAIERRNEAAYQLLIARQQLSLAQAGTRLQTLRLTEANHGVKLSKLQKQRADIQAKTYQEWVRKGLNEFETSLLSAYSETAKRRLDIAGAEAALAMAQAITTAATASPAGAAAAAAGAAAVEFVAGARLAATGELISAERDTQIASFWASYERRKDEWLLQQALAEQDQQIGDEQIELVNDHVEIVTQEKVVAELQASHAKDTVEFLTNKFNNVELYDWMSDTLEQVYRFFLQQATAVAKLAANQLGFERQEVPPAFIRDDYWTGPSNGSSNGGGSVDRKGLTGSARLLQDIYQLDQYAFETKKRKLELTKTISLAQLAPAEFQHLRETGVMVICDTDGAL